MLQMRRLNVGILFAKNVYWKHLTRNRRAQYVGVFAGICYLHYKSIEESKI